MTMPYEIHSQDDVLAEPLQENFNHIDSEINKLNTNTTDILTYFDPIAGHRHNGSSNAGAPVDHFNLSNTDNNLCHPQYALLSKTEFEDLTVMPSKVLADHVPLFRIRQKAGPTIFNVNYGGDVQATGPLTLIKDLIVGGYSDITGSQEIGDYLKVTGFTDLNGTMDVADYATFQDNVDISGALDVTQYSTFGGDVDVVGTMDLTGGFFYEFGGVDIRTAATPSTVGITEAVGVEDKFARGDHEHKLSIDNTNIRYILV